MKAFRSLLPLALIGAACCCFGLQAHPRIWLDGPTLTKLRQRAANNDPSWTALKTQCDGYLTGVVNWPDGVDYPDGFDIGEGYQGSGYYEPILELGIAYWTIKPSDPATAEKYALKIADILTKMSAPPGAAHAVDALRDDGYGIRFYGAGMALGYDWAYPVLTAAQRVRIYTAIEHWISAFKSGGFENDFPQGNYFAGYYCAQGLGAIAVEGDDPNGTTLWNDWLNNLHYGMVQPYYAQWLAGGGWPEGWNYGPFGTLNMIYPVWAAKTGKGIDLFHDPSKPFRFPFDQAPYLMQFAWPNEKSMDNRGALYGGDNPAAAQPELFTELAGLLTNLGDGNAATFHRFAHDVRDLNGAAPLWAEFLLWDPNAPEATFHTIPLSYVATGTNSVAVRATWSRATVWASFVCGAYTNYGGAGEEFFDKGGLAINRGAVPFLVNTPGALFMNTPGQNDGDGFFDAVYNDNFGNHDADPTQGNRTMYNIFYTKNPTRWGQDWTGVTDSAAHLSRFEDRNGHVYMRGSNLADNYGYVGDVPDRPVQKWSRDVLYIRPQLFLVLDRTTILSSSLPQFLAFHFGKTPASAGVIPGGFRYFVSDGSLFKGAVTTVFPKNETVKLVDVFGSHKVYRLDLYPPTHGVTQRWLTVLDAGGSAASTYSIAPISAADGNVVSGGLMGVELTSPAGVKQTVLFGTGEDGMTVKGTLKFLCSTADEDKLVTDLAPNHTFAETVTPQGGKFLVTLTPGTGTLKVSASGVLEFK